MRQILIASQKGGVGKTTVCVQLARAAARAGQRVVVVDTDPIGCVGAALGCDGAAIPGEGVIAVDVGVDLLTVSEAQVMEWDRRGGIGALLEAKAASSYDLVLVDSQPYSGEGSLGVLQACAEMVPVMRADPLTFRTLPSFLKVLAMLQIQERGPKVHGFVLTLPPTEAVARRWEDAIRGRFGARILSPSVPWSAALRAVMAAAITTPSLVGAGTRGEAIPESDEATDRVFDQLFAGLG